MTVFKVKLRNSSRIALVEFAKKPYVVQTGFT